MGSTHPYIGRRISGDTILLFCSIRIITGKSGLCAVAVIGLLASASKKPTGWWGLHGPPRWHHGVSHLLLFGYGSLHPVM